MVNPKLNPGANRGRKNRHERIKKALKAAYLRDRHREKRRTAKKLASQSLASQSLPVCSMCMQKLDNSTGPDQYQTKVDDIQALTTYIWNHLTGKCVAIKVGMLCTWLAIAKQLQSISKGQN